MNDFDENSPIDAEADFKALGLVTELIAALERLRIDAPTDIQRHVLPAAFAGRDVLARALTGSGKTNTYLLPILQTATPGAGVQAIVVQPTRALALQFQRNLQRFAPEKPLSSIVLLGGNDQRDGADPLADNPDVIITIPHGATVLAERAGQDWSALKILAIDEVDAILEDRGPRPLEQLHAVLPDDHLTILLAGDLNDDVRALGAMLLRDPLEIDTDTMESRAATAQHSYFAVSSDEKFDALLSFCKQECPKLAIVVTCDEETGHEIAHRLDRARVSCRWINERQSRGRREQSRHRSRGGSEVIVACDPAPRRLCTIPATHLLNYDLPADVDTYVHRLDQVSRLRKSGDVISFVEPEQEALIPAIEERLGKTVSKREPLSIPERRPRSDRGPRSDHRSSGRPPRRDDRKPAYSDPSPPPTSSTGANPAPSPNGGAPASGRHNEPLIRDKELDARGVVPPPKTLGGRFRTNRRGKPLR